MEKSLIIVRGISGSGKSTFADLMAENKYPVLSADMYFINDKTKKYEFDASKLSDAHQWCNEHTEAYMIEHTPKIFVANTFTTEWELKSYFKLAKKYNYTVFSIVVENRNNTVNVHNVTAETLAKQKAIFSIKL